MRHNHFTVKLVHCCDRTNKASLTTKKRDELLQPQDAGEESVRVFTDSSDLYLSLDKLVETLSGTRKHVGN